MSEGADRIAITTSLADWSFIDGGMDNAVSNAIDSCEENAEEIVEMAGRIREIGWEVTRPLLQPFVDAGVWPPSAEAQEQPVTVGLTVEEWEFVVRDLADGAKSYLMIDMPDLAVSAHRILQMLSAALDATAPRWSAEGR